MTIPLILAPMYRIMMTLVACPHCGLHKVVKAQFICGDQVVGEEDFLSFEEFKKTTAAWIAKEEVGHIERIGLLVGLSATEERFRSLLNEARSDLARVLANKLADSLAEHLRMVALAEASVDSGHGQPQYRN